MFLPPLIVGNEILDLLQKLSWPKNLAISDFSVSPWKLAMLLLQIIATIVALRSQSCNSIGNKRHFLLQIWTSKRSIGAWCHKKWALSQVMSRQVLRSVPICLKNFLTMKHFFLICNLESDYWTQKSSYYAYFVVGVLGAPIMVEWGIPEKVNQNAVQKSWTRVNMTPQSKVMRGCSYILCNTNLGSRETV